VLTCAGPPPAKSKEVAEPVNLMLALGQDLVGIFLMLAILFQARGAGLSATFGGDSSVYRSRRGVEKRLWQFTIVLMVLFCVFAVASYVLH
jgi:preprotein translocase subunit SecG